MTPSSSWSALPCSRLLSLCRLDLKLHLVRGFGGSKSPSWDTLLKELVQLMIGSSLGFGEHQNTWNEVDKSDATKEQANLLAPSSPLIRQHQGNSVVLQKLDAAIICWRLLTKRMPVMYWIVTAIEVVLARRLGLEISTRLIQPLNS